MNHAIGLFDKLPKAQLRLITYKLWMGVIGAVLKNRKTTRNWYMPIHFVLKEISYIFGIKHVKARSLHRFHGLIFKGIVDIVFTDGTWFKFILNQFKIKSNIPDESLIQYNIMLTNY